MFEDELIPLFEKCGTIWDLRLMMDPMTGTNRGYAFVTFTSRDAAHNAVKEVRNSLHFSHFIFSHLKYEQNRLRLVFSIKFSRAFESFILIFLSFLCLTETRISGIRDFGCMHIFMFCRSIGCFVRDYLIILSLSTSGKKQTFSMKNSFSNESLLFVPLNFVQFMHVVFFFVVRCFEIFFFFSFDMI